MHLIESWTFFFWFQAPKDSRPLLNFHYEDETLDWKNFISVTDNRLQIIFYPLGRRYFSKLLNPESYYSVQIIWISEEEEMLIYINQQPSFGGVEPLPLQRRRLYSDICGECNLKNYEISREFGMHGDIMFAQRAFGRDWALNQYEEDTSLWPKEVVTEWYMTVGIAVALVLIILYANGLATYRGVDRPFNDRIFIVALGILDFSTDYQLVVHLISRNHAYAWPLLYITAGSYCVTLFALVLWYRSHRQGDNILSHWLIRQSWFFLPLILLAASNASIIEISWSHLFPVRKFNMPITADQKVKLGRFRIITLLMEDIPHMVFQIVFLKVGADSSRGTQILIQLALLVSGLSFLLTLVTFCTTPTGTQNYRSQWVQVKNAKRSPTMFAFTINKKFKNVLPEEYTDVLVTGLGKQNYRIMFQYTQGADTHDVAKIIQRILEDAQIVNEESEVIFEIPPKLMEVIDDIVELANDLRVTKGNLNFMKSKNELVLHLGPGLDIDIVNGFMEYLKGEQIDLSLSEIFQMKHIRDKSFNRDNETGLILRTDVSQKGQKLSILKKPSKGGVVELVPRQYFHTAPVGDVQHSEHLDRTLERMLGRYDRASTVGSVKRFPGSFDMPPHWIERESALSVGLYGSDDSRVGGGVCDSDSEGQNLAGRTVADLRPSMYSHSKSLMEIDPRTLPMEIQQHGFESAEGYESDAEGTQTSNPDAHEIARMSKTVSLGVPFKIKTIARRPAPADHSFNRRWSGTKRFFWERK